MIKKQFYLFLMIVFLFNVKISASSFTMAVLDFENNSIFHAEDYQSLKKGLTDIIISELSQIQSIQLVERQELKRILDEIKLSQAGITDDEASIKIGKIIGAKYLVFGGFMVTMEEKIRIDVRIVEVETGLTIKAEEVTGKTKKILNLTKQLSQKVLNNLEVSLTKEEKNNLKKSSNISMISVLLFSQGLEAEDQQQLKKAGQYYLKALKDSPDFNRAKFRLKIITKRLQVQKEKEEEK